MAKEFCLKSDIHQEFVAAAVISSFNILLSAKNVSDWFIYCSGRKTVLNYSILLLIFVSFAHGVTRLIEISLLGKPEYYPIGLDMFKSIMSQLANPLAMTVMYLRIYGMFWNSARWKTTLKIFGFFAASGLLFGLIVAVYREYLNYTFRPNEDKVFNGLRNILGAINSLYNIILQIAFSFVFFYELYTKLLDQGVGSRKKGMILSAVFEGSMILVIGISYAIMSVHTKYKFLSSLLPTVGVLSTRFMLDLIIGFKQYSDKNSKHGKTANQSVQLSQAQEKLENANLSPTAPGSKILNVRN